jgi:hypothetical protein
MTADSQCLAADGQLLTAFCTHTCSDAFVILKPGGRPGVARHERALPLIIDPYTDN